MEQAYEHLTQSSHQVAAALYQTATASGGAGPEQGPGQDAGPSDGAAPEDEVIDAEYVDVEAEEEK
jgi:molecular chaperone DnaK